MFQVLSLSGSLNAVLVAWREEFSSSNPNLRRIKFFSFFLKELESYSGLL